MFKKSTKKIIYLDNASTTPLDPRVEQVMKPFWSERFGNPSSIYSLGVDAKFAVEEAREKISGILNCRPHEIIFTAGGTESVNLAIRGVFKASKIAKPHIITSSVEHHSVLECLKDLETDGVDVTYLKVDKEGFVNPADVLKAVKKNTILVSIMYANNEVGTIQSISEIANKLRKLNPSIIFHTDACQASGALDLNINKLGVDLMSLNASKIYGPKQVGLLYIRNGTKISPIILGGGQERNLRSGTENVPGIVGFATALEIARKEMLSESKRLSHLRDYFISKLLKKIPSAVLNGPRERRLPNNVNISILNIEGEPLLLYLDAQGICASAGSACASTEGDPSHVLSALGKGKGYEHGIRFTLGRYTTKKDIDYVLKVMPPIIEEFQRILGMGKKVRRTTEFSVTK